MISDGTAIGAEASGSVDDRGSPPSADPSPVSSESPTGLAMSPLGPAPVGSEAVEPATRPLLVSSETAPVSSTGSEMDESSPAGSS